MTVQRKCGCGHDEQAPVNASLVATHGAMSGGHPLESSTRALFEGRFGRSFDHVRVHTDSRAAASAKAVNALAYTVGSRIVFASGQYAPESPSGRRLLAHELAHVVQQDSQVRPGLPPVLQRWSADGPAPAGTNTIVCDGSGGIRVQIGTGNDPTALPCVLDCLTRHEESHRSDALAANAAVCNGKANGSQVNFNTVHLSCNRPHHRCLSCWFRQQDTAEFSLSEQY